MSCPVALPSALHHQQFLLQRNFASQQIQVILPTVKPRSVLQKSGGLHEGKMDEGIFPALVPMALPCPGGAFGTP
jgi:hypothetical protein